jgi:predicted nucleotidyltransferase
MNYNQELIDQFCLKWKIKQLALFGSSIREDFNINSDIDCLVTFEPEVIWGFEIAEINQELSTIFNRKIDLVSRKSIELSKNVYKKNEILSSYKIIYDKAA